jgi:hypothetical protein
MPRGFFQLSAAVQRRPAFIERDHEVQIFDGIEVEILHRLDWRIPEGVPVETGPDIVVIVANVEGATTGRAAGGRFVLPNPPTTADAVQLVKT